MIQFQQLANLSWLIPLLTIPLLIHWLNQRHPRLFRFSSVEQLKKTMAGRSRPSRWRHIIMLLLRTLALLLLLMAFLRPILFDKAADQSKIRHTLILVDHSLSMTHQENGTTPQKRAIAEVRRLLDQMSAEDRFNVILVNRQPFPAFPDFSMNRAGAMRFLETAPAALTEANFTSANALAAAHAKQAAAAPDVYYFSDFQRKNWSNVRFDALPPGSRLHFMNMSPQADRPNQSVRDIRLDQEVVIEGGTVDVKVRVANHSAQAWKGTLEAGFDEIPQGVKDVTVSPWSETDVLMSLPVPRSGLLRLRARLPADGLAADNERFLVVRVKSREQVVLLDGNSQVTEFGIPSTFLTAAVNPYEQGKGSYIPRAVEAKTFTQSSLAATKRVVACRLPEITEEQAKIIISYLRNGGGLLLFLDGYADAKNLEKLAKEAGVAMPLRLGQKLGQDELHDGAMKVAHADMRSRFLRLFQGERIQNLSLLEFYDFHRAAATETGKVILRYADETPAMAECSIGLGSLILCNFSVAEASSNLARQRLFPVWIHEILLRMNQNNSATMDPFHVGDNITSQTWAAEAIGREIKDPLGFALKSTRLTPQGEMMRVTFPTSLSGFYRMTGAKEDDLLCFAVNVSAEESDLRGIDPAVLPQRAGDHDTSTHGSDQMTDYSALLRGRPAYHWFVLAALAVLLLEGCLFKQPRVAPR
jgi:hypothetical protein